VAAVEDMKAEVAKENAAKDRIDAINE